MASQTSKEPTASGSGSLGNVHSFQFGWPFTPNHKSSEPFSTTRKAIDRALERRVWRERLRNECFP
jgi:hypothetical protein